MTILFRKICLFTDSKLKLSMLWSGSCSFEWTIKLLIVVVWVITTYCSLVGRYQISEEHTASVFKVWTSHHVITQKTTSWIFVDVKISNVAKFKIVAKVKCGMLAAGTVVALFQLQYLYFLPWESKGKYQVKSTNCKSSWIRPKSLWR
jgi:hypothetical protein